jgi:hypothetical protein
MKKVHIPFAAMVGIGLGLMIPANGTSADSKQLAGQSAQWPEWAISIPTSHNPMLDATGVDFVVGQRGSPWFLAGTFSGGPASAAFAAEWEAIQRIPVDHKIEITTRDGTRTRVAFVSATGEAIVVREKSGGRSIARAEIRQVRVADPARRVRNGLIWTAVGAGAGAAIGAAICPYCPNEGHGYKFVGPGVAIGAGIGALGFLPAPYRTVYKSK